jgi:hypothetical protein
MRDNDSLAERQTAVRGICRIKSQIASNSDIGLRQGTSRGRESVPTADVTHTCSHAVACLCIGYDCTPDAVMTEI